jgi:hypothetical protein
MHLAGSLKFGETMLTYEYATYHALVGRDTYHKLLIVDSCFNAYYVSHGPVVVFADNLR